MLANYPAHSCWLFFNEIERHHCPFPDPPAFQKGQTFNGLCFLVRMIHSLRPLPWVMVKSIALGLSLRSN